jgi:hypothetical protein
MADEIKIQPGDAEEQVGQSADAATGDEEVQNIPADEWAKKSDEEKLALINNALKMRGESTRKYMEASDIKKQYEYEKARADWLKDQNEQIQNSVQELLARREAELQPKGSGAAQPPPYDPYNPEKWAKDYQAWFDGQRAEDKKNFTESIENLRNETDIKFKTQQLDSYLDKVLPTLGPDVRKQDIITFFEMNKGKILPLIEDGSVDRAIKEEQARLNNLKSTAIKQQIEDKKKAAQNAQLPPGSPLATQTPDIEQLKKMSPSEREDTIAARVRQLRKEGLI